MLNGERKELFSCSVTVYLATLKGLDEFIDQSQSGQEYVHHETEPERIEREARIIRSEQGRLRKAIDDEWLVKGTPPSKNNKSDREWQFRHRCEQHPIARARREAEEAEEKRRQAAERERVEWTERMAASAEAEEKRRQAAERERIERTKRMAASAEAEEKRHQAAEQERIERTKRMAASAEAEEKRRQAAYEQALRRIAEADERERFIAEAYRRRADAGQQGRRLSSRIRASIVEWTRPLARTGGKEASETLSQADA
jgi:hypothetical protein